jgi:hypothetical protein
MPAKRRTSPAAAAFSSARSVVVARVRRCGRTITLPSLSPEPTSGDRGATHRVSLVNDGFDLHSELARGVRDAAAAWRFIRLYAAGYARPIVAGDGCDDEELRAAETRLGFPLPAALREAYALIGERFDLTRRQDRLLAPHLLGVDDTGQVLVSAGSASTWPSGVFRCRR